ncbi:MAG: pirin family protein [Acidimicrobiales bacterium]
MTSNTSRPVEFTHSAYTGGPIHGVIGSNELRKRLNPFVFLDHFDVATDSKWGFDWHPHSGVATFTYVQAADLDHADTSGASGRLHQGGVQWMASGNGIWHQEYYHPRSEGSVNGLQLWIALPPELENGPNHYQDVQAEDLPVVGNTRVLAGSYMSAASPVTTPVDFNVFDVTLNAASAGEPATWEFTPPEDHDIAWLYTQNGTVETAGTTVAPRTIAVFESSSEPITITAANDGASFIVGTAPANHQPIVASRGSMHTNAEALRSGQQRIAKIADQARIG